MYQYVKLTIFIYVLGHIVNNSSLFQREKKVFKLNVNQMYELAPFTKTDHTGYRM